MTQEILFRYFRGQASAEEQRQIGAWLLTGADAQKEFEEAQFLFEGITLYGPSRSESRNPIVRKIIRFARVASAIAAAVAVIAGTAFLVEHRTLDKLSGEMMAFSTQPGQKADITLTDGTVVSLNADSRLEYPVLFRGKERRVKLEGEALFRVKHDVSHPFIVSNYATDIAVLGTTFEVRAREEEHLFSTTLVEGSVRVQNLANLSDVQLMRPNDVVTLSGGRLNRTTLKRPVTLPWMEGLVSLDEARDFQGLMSQFERVYGVHIITRVNPSIEGLSGELRVAEGIEHALKVLQHVVDFKYEIYEGNIIIK